MKLLPGRILVVLLALIVGVALGAGLVGALRTPAPPSVEPIQLDGERRNQPGDDDTKKKRGKDTKDKRGKDKRGKDKPPAGNDAPVPQNDPPDGGGAPPPPPPPPPANDDDDDDDDGDDSDDGGGDD